MSGIQLIVHDDGLASLAPLTDLRASFDVRTGARTTLERVLSLVGLDAPDAVVVPEALAEITREAHPGVSVNEIPEGDCLLVSGRWVLPSGKLSEIPANGAVSDGSTGHLLAMRAEAGYIRSYIENGAVPRGIANHPVEDARVIEHPWDVIRHRDACLGHDLDSICQRIPFETESVGVTMVNGENVFIHQEATVLPSAMLDASRGPIVIDAGATVRLGAVIIGPAYVGRGATVLDGALVKGGTSVGPVCKVAGEVGGTIIQGYSNKAHDGHIGDSWLGEWVNLGAGTVNSNLLNTYGEVTAVSDGTRHRTGLTFLGTIAGDHVKTAICTRLMTGGIMGTGAMVASSAPTHGETARFAWLTDASAQSYRLDKFLEVMRTAMARRGVTPSEAYVARVSALAESTEGVRA